MTSTWIRIAGHTLDLLWNVCVCLCTCAGDVRARSLSIRSCSPHPCYSMSFYLLRFSDHTFWNTVEHSNPVMASIPQSPSHTHTYTRTHVWPHCQDASLRLPPHVWGKRWRWGERTAEGKATRGWGACRNLHSAPGWWCLRLHALLSDSNSNNNYNNNSVKA